MKWLPLSLDKINEIASQVHEVSELYKILFVQLKMEKQEELHALLKEQIGTGAIHLENQSSFNTSILSEDDLTQETIVDYSRLDVNNTEWVNKVNKEKVLKSLHQAIENRLFQLEQFQMMNSRDERSSILLEIRRRLALILVDFPIKTIRKISELREALFYMKKPRESNDHNQSYGTSVFSGVDDELDGSKLSNISSVSASTISSMKQTVNLFDRSPSRVQFNRVTSSRQSNQGNNAPSPRSDHKDFRMSSPGTHSPIIPFEERNVTTPTHRFASPTYAQSFNRKINLTHNDAIKLTQAEKMKEIFDTSVDALEIKDELYSKPTIKQQQEKKVYSPRRVRSHQQVSLQEPKRNVKPIYRWEVQNRSGSNNIRERTHSGVESPRRSNQATPRSLTPSTKDRKNFEMLMKLTPQDFEFLQEKRDQFLKFNSNGIPRSPRSPHPTSIRSSQPLDLHSPRFLTKGGGRLASDGNASSRIYLTGIGKQERSLLDINTVADTEGLFITSQGPYQDPNYDPKPVNKSKWMSRETFKTAGYISEFYKDRSLPEFISSGIPYESANPSVAATRFRPVQPERFVSNQSFVTAVPTSGVSLLDKQYSLGSIVPNRATYHSTSRNSSPYRYS